MKKIFALDLGTNSIGWALRNPDLTENQIEKFGVLTFNKGVGLGKTGEYSYAAERTKKRSMRRLYQSRKYRLWATLENLINEGYCPLSMEDLNKWRHYSKEEALNNNNGGRVYPIDNLVFDAWIKLDFNNCGKPEYSSPYQLRKELAEVKLDFNKEENRFKLGRALYHIAQRRGFKSSRKGADDVKEREDDENEVVDLQYSEKKKNKVISELFKQYSQASTIGYLFALLENDNVRIRESIAQYAIRENYKDEIKYIFNFQDLDLNHKLFMKLVESGKNKNDGSIFYKRPLRSQKGLIGKCTLELGKYRAPVSHPNFETFRAWSFLNNIKYKPLEDKAAYWQPLPIDLKKDIYINKFFRKSKSYFPFAEIAEFIITKGNNWELNYKPKTTVTGCPVSARLKEIFGEDYMHIQIPKQKALKSNKSYYDIEDIWHVLFSYEDQEFVSAFATEKLNLNDVQTKQFVIAWNAMPVGYGMLSINAINKINNFLKKGLIYTEAVLLANIPSIISNELWTKNEQLFLENISDLINENRRQKTILNIVNNLVSQHKNQDQKSGFKDSSYQLNSSDKQDIFNAIEDTFGSKKWKEKNDADKEQIVNTVTRCYQAYFKTSGLTRKDIKGERHFEIISDNHFYYKTDSGYYRLPKLIDTVVEFLQVHFDVNDGQLKKIYHPSEINIYPPAKPDENGILKLGSPKTGSFKNPMAMRTLHELRKLMNYMIETDQIDSDTRIVVEVARELNDSNKRWAIEAWQRQREAENQEFALAIEELINAIPEISANSKNENDIDKMRLWYEQNDEETVPAIADAKKEVKGIKWSENIKSSYKQISTQKLLIDKYRLWKEQGCQCIYTGKIISISDLFNENVIDFEHTLPRSKSFDNSLANMTVCYADFNRTVKKNQIPFTLNCYDEILPRIEKWKEKVERIKQQIDFWKTKSKTASEKQWKDDAIRQRHLWQMELDYWKNKVDRFTLVEITSGFKNSQLIDSQLISKYAFHYLKTFFEKVDVQKGSVTAAFRKIYQLQVPDEKKDRSKHSHHAKDAAVLTLIPIAAKRDAVLEKYYECKENKKPFTETEPYKGFKREFVWGIDDSVLINNITNGQALTPAKRKIRKRGKEQFIDGTNQPMWATGDSIRGQLHQETFYGAIKPAKRDEKGTILKDDKGSFILDEKIKYVIRVPFQYKKDSNTPGFKTIEEIEKQIVDEGLKAQIRKQVEKAGDLKDAFEQGIYMFDKKGNKVNKIRHIRVWASVSEPLIIKKQTNLSKIAYKQNYYASNATNSYFAIYIGDDKKDFDFRNLLETAQVLSTNSIKSGKDLFEPSIIITKGKKQLDLTLTYVLENGMKIIFKRDKDDDLKKISNNELTKRLYVYTNFEKDGRLNFKYHLEARSKIEEEYSESEVDFEIPKPTLRFGYAKYDFYVEEYDFKVNLDGTINWK
ncbi:CRISPR-associated endonuclease Csn1 [Daejeonella rubra]|uniref:CRISPR-associated endonuclease Csn1 n=1 Tax=Daejeonella rubra TaxID=990371 RepID=A0A1G9TGP5_9SPHI|nr:type II CRISPR RNA-guided endonuclease Cas9 [Daejeonella rubra]SDM46782.1 CRISPR-associated endonuclease Csn1 [Daejeonella rubra]